MAVKAAVPVAATGATGGTPGATCEAVMGVAPHFTLEVCEVGEGGEVR